MFHVYLCIVCIHVSIVHCMGTHICIGVQGCGSPRLASGVFPEFFYSLLFEFFFFFQLNPEFDKMDCLPTQLGPGNPCLGFMRAGILLGMSCPDDTGC